MNSDILVVSHLRKPPGRLTYYFGFGDGVGLVPSVGLMGGIGTFAGLGGSTLPLSSCSGCLVQVGGSFLSVITILRPNMSKNIARFLHRHAS
jgi:hypothetical protein